MIVKWWLWGILGAVCGCAIRPSTTEERHRIEIRELIRALAEPPEAERFPADRPDHRLILWGEQAVPDLSVAIRHDPNLRIRERAAYVLGRIYQETELSRAREAYVDAVEEALASGRARGLLEHAHLFQETDGRVLGLLHRALAAGEVSPGLVTAAATMTEDQSTAPLMRLVARLPATDHPEWADIAIRYLGRAARHGRRDALEFLLACTTSDRPALAEKAGRELSLLAGRVVPRSWRAWWLDRASGTRWEWLIETFSLALGKKLDPTDRSHLGELVARLTEAEDMEPEFWFLERALGRRFGYRSPRDAFDPDVPPVAVIERNKGAIATIKSWWRENEDYLYYHPAAEQFVLHEEARRQGLPVDPRTGRPATASSAEAR
ncbi:MAG: hypothetical protein HY716_04535 [Planctomycetes bacterium]|nr:hypothetical protein [Planctomycetota bacterium]